MTILAGVYFPLTVFSDKIKLLLIYLSPFGYLLDTVRIILSSNFDIYNLIGRIFGLTIIGILFYAFSVKIMSVSINYSRKNGMNFSSIFNNHY